MLNFALFIILLYKVQMFINGMQDFNPTMIAIDLLTNETRFYPQQSFLLNYNPIFISYSIRQL